MFTGILLPPWVFGKHGVSIIYLLDLKGVSMTRMPLPEHIQFENGQYFSIASKIIRDNVPLYEM